MNEARRCDVHGFFDGRRCPICDAVGEQILDAARRRRLSKFLSGVLRHFPADVGIGLDERGWTDRSALVSAAAREYDWVDGTAVDAVVLTDSKGRFEADRDRIRASYGHSVPVDLEPTAGPVPNVLYHGTAPDSAPSILAEGIRPMARQLVHLSASVEDAREVGARHASDPVLLRIDAAGMLDDGHRITKRGRSVYTAEFVPPAYVQRSD